MGLDDIENKVGPEAAKIEADAKQEAPKYEQEGKDFAEKEAKDLKSRL